VGDLLEQMVASVAEIKDLMATGDRTTFITKETEK
jgi:hypothetical protein